MPRRGPSTAVGAGFSLVMLIFFVLVIIGFLKILRVIPDPPDTIDVVGLIINAAVAIAGSVVTYLFKSFRDLNTRVGNLEGTLNTLNKDMADQFKSLSTELVHIRDLIDVNNRLARLEAKKT